MGISSILKDRQSEILDKWTSILKREMPGISDNSDAAILDSIPDLLKSLVEELESESQSSIVFYSQEHGQNRAAFEEYTLGHVIREYHHLRTAIFDVIDKHTQVEVAERDMIIYVIDRAIEQAADTYHRIRRQVLVDARKVAEQKADQLNIQDKNREDFIQSIIHDLNGPLNNVKACIELIERADDIEQVPTFLNLIKASAYRAKLLVEDFLDVSSVTGEMNFPINRSSVNISEELQKEILVFKLIYHREITYDQRNEDIIAKIDLKVVRRAFDNLMNNAIKHSDRDTEIRVNCAVNNEYLTIGINNRGEISQETLDKIFDRYYKISENARGWGIGLAFVKNVAQMHGGDVAVKSNEEGVTFEMAMKLN